MTWRRRLRRRLLWAGVLLGLVLLLLAVSVLRACAWSRDVLNDNASRMRQAIERKRGTMTRTLTLIVAIAAAALAVAPVALGEGRLAPLYPPSQVATYPDAAERPAARPSALDLASAAGRLQFSAVRDAFTARAPGHPPPYHAPLATPRATRGGGVEWPQIGVGVAAGLALAIGIGLAVQTVRARPLAH